MSDIFKDQLSEEELAFLEIYEEDLDAIRPLSAEEREALLKKAVTGDEDSVGLLIQDFMRTALDVTHMYAGQGVLLQDLIGEGNLALVGFFKKIPEGITSDKLDQAVTGELVKVFDELVKESADEENEKQKMVKKVEKVASAAKALSDSLGRKVTVDELSENAKISKKQIRDALKNTANKIEGLEEEK